MGARKTIYFCILLCASSFSSSLHAQLSLDRIFSDHMVLQRDKPVMIRGKAIPSENISVQFNKQKKNTITAGDSSWSVLLDPLPASQLPSSLIISSARQKIIIKDILVGDIWLCIGQSNMEWPMQQEAHFEQELSRLGSSSDNDARGRDANRTDANRKDANRKDLNRKDSNRSDANRFDANRTDVKRTNSTPGIARRLRFFNPSYAGKGIYGRAFTDSVFTTLNRLDFYRGHWAICDSISIRRMSAVGYYFGKVIAGETGIPVGLINLAVGGAPIETFISRDALSGNGDFKKKLEGDWLKNSNLPAWTRQRGRENIPGAYKDTSGPDHAFKPGFAFDAGIKPLENFPIKGIIWYQGESNAQEMERVNEYAALQKLMVNDMRSMWKDPHLPFYYVQLSSIDTLKYNSRLWPQFRDEQRKIMDDIPHTGMAVTYDHGALHDVHPGNKMVVGERLSRWALKQDYGRDIEASGPLPSIAVMEESAIRIYFSHTAKGLTVNGLTANDIADNDHQAEGRLKGFTLDGIRELPAKIDGGAVLVSLPAGRTEMPGDVYYGWKPFSDANLLNSEGLPATAFRIPVSSAPPLIPLPKQVTWNGRKFELGKFRYIRIKDNSLAPVAEILRENLASKGVYPALSHGNESGPAIIFSIDKSVRGEEAYRVTVNNEHILISANSPRGAYYGVQTLLQLVTAEKEVWGAEINDWPSFQWRGYMVDVGRNFQTVSQLKQQIDVMAAYKLNIFHFHLTENIAWRLEVPGFPELTEPASMLRNKGSYYRVEEMKDLIRYCRERNITLVPEIDMPGHSDAFKRAMGVDMQSPEGKTRLKKILEVICDTYDVEYIHIGGDEVKITDSLFLPEMISFLSSRNKKLIGWDPGGSMGQQVTRQLWMKDGPQKGLLKYIDSRHLYLNHMDPLESVTTIYHRRIGDRDSSDEKVIGGTVCVWHDRNIRQEEDLLIMNPVYPALVTFAEKSWRGGGYSSWVTNTVDPNGFSAFEQRLMAHKKKNFHDKPFPYWKQSGISWKLYGPYENDGDLKKQFPPETDFSGLVPALNVTGGTIVLRHFWHPVVQGVLKDPKENTTWYAARSYWSDADTVAGFRIGFNNFSRSYVTDEPLAGTWNNQSAMIFVNGEEVPPPAWKRAGMKGDAEHPLIDAGYEYRPPTMIRLKKGWNNFLLKLPVGSFKGRNSNNPVKWMFTVVKEEQ